MTASLIARLIPPRAWPGVRSRQAGHGPPPARGRSARSPGGTDRRTSLTLSPDACVHGDLPGQLPHLGDERIGGLAQV